MSTAGRLGIVIVNYGSHELIAENLAPDTVREAMAQVYVVDNFSDTSERKAIRDLVTERGWVLIELGTNNGFGGGVNAGVQAARNDGCDVLLALNPDATVTAPVLTALADQARETPLALISPIINTSSGAPYFRGSRVNILTGEIKGGWLSDGQPGPTEWRNWLTGACLAFHTDTFDAVGGMSEHYFLYWEDVDFSMRAAAAGIELVLRADLVAVHDEGGTQDRGTPQAKSDLYYYYNSRNRLLFARDHVPGSARLRWLVETPRQTLRIWLRGGRRQLFEQPSGAVAAIGGALAGIRTLLTPRSGRPTSTQPSVLIAHPSADLYGSDRVLLESVAALVQGGFRTVTALPSAGPLKEAIERVGGTVEICPVPVLRKSALSPVGLVKLAAEALIAVPRMRRLIRDAAADVVYVNTITIPLWLIVSRLTRVPAVCHVHEAESSLGALLRRAMYAPLCLADRLIVNSQFTLGVAAGVWPRLRRRSTLIYNAVQGPESSPAPPRFHPQPVRLLFIGRLSPRKGAQVAVDALRLLHDMGTAAHLAMLGAVFPGYEWFERQLREQVDNLQLTDCVDFIGFDTHIWKHLAACDVVLVPSQFDESFGNTAVEAMLACRPLVVSDTSGLREAAAGYTMARKVPVGDPQAIALAVRELMANWGTVIKGAGRDRERALHKHAPQVYRAAVLDFFHSEMTLIADGGTRLNATERTGQNT